MERICVRTLLSREKSVQASAPHERDAAVDVALGVCGRALARGDVALVAPAARVASRVSRANPALE